MICANVQAMKGGVDVNGMPALSRRFYPEDGHVHRQDTIRAARGISNLEHVCSDCRALRGQPSSASTFLPRTKPGHGCRPVDLSREPARYRSRPSANMWNATCRAGCKCSLQLDWAGRQTAAMGNEIERVQAARRLARRGRRLRTREDRPARHHQAQAEQGLARPGSAQDRND